MRCAPCGCDKNNGMCCETHPAILHQILKYALSPRILKAYRAVLELLAYELDVLVVLFTVCPILLVLHAVAACALQLFHVLAVNRALDLIGVVVPDFFLIEFLGIDSAPGIDDIGQYERYEQGYIEHRAQRELTRAGVSHRQ